MSRLTVGSWIKNLVKVVKNNHQQQQHPSIKFKKTFVPNKNKPPFLISINQAKNYTNFINFKLFSTSSNKSAIPPLLWLLAKPVTKLGAILAGRGFRKWWAGYKIF